MSKTKDKEPKDKEIGVPAIRKKFDVLVAYGAQHIIHAPDHEFFNASGCVACWMVRNLGQAIIIIDTVVDAYEKGGLTPEQSPFLGSMRKFLEETDITKGAGGRIQNTHQPLITVSRTSGLTEPGYT